MFTLARLLVSSIPIIGFFVSAIFLQRSKKCHPSLIAFWAVGLVTAICAFFNEFTWEDQKFETSL